MLKRLLLLAFLILPLPAFATCAISNGSLLLSNGKPVCGADPNPLNFPALTSTQASNMFTFLGSFSINSSDLQYGGNSMYVVGSTMYIEGQACDIGTHFCASYAFGIATVPIPTLSGTPDYTGGNGPSGGVVPTELPAAPRVTPPIAYTLTAAPVAGATSATLTTAPPAAAVANNDWYIYIGSYTTTYEITGISGDTITWATPLPSGTYTTAVQIYQWNPTNPWVSTSGKLTLTGTMVQGNTLIETGAATYDTGGQTIGWAVESTLPLSGTSWGNINVPTQGASYSRSVAGPIYPTPSIWQSTFGPAYSTNGNFLSIAENNIPQGPSFQEFDPANVNFAGTTTPFTPALLYTTQTGQSLGGRSYSGPFPLNTTTGYYPVTLTGAVSAGATSVTISQPTATFTMTGNVATNGTFTITTLGSGTPVLSGIYYTATDTAGAFAAGTKTQPSYVVPPGSTLAVGDVITLNTTTVSAATGDTLTFTPTTYDNSDPWTMFFSDGESRVGTISSSGVFTFSTPLTGASTASASVAPMGDNWFTYYDGPYETGFFVPNTSTFLAMGFQDYGPHRLRTETNPCGAANPSNNFSTPIAPDTLAYTRLLMYAYPASVLVAGADGSQPTYQADPSFAIPFPDDANVLNSAGCPEGGQGGAFFDRTDDIFYIAKGSNPTVILEYKVTPP